MPISTLTTTDGFVLTDLPDAPATGIVRVARKVLTSSAGDLARSATYSFAIFEMQRGGASAGVNAEGGAVAPAQDAFVAEVAPMVADGLHLDAGKGFDPAALAPLADVDSRNPLGGSPEVTAAGVVAAAEAAVGSLEGRKIAIEGIDAGAVPVALAAAVAERGGRIIGVSTAERCVIQQDGLAVEVLTSPSLAEAGKTDKAVKLWGASAEIIFCGSRPGVLTHMGTPFVRATAIVPWGPVPLTTKALVDLGKEGIVVLPDFVTIAGGLVAGYLDGDEATITATVTSRIADVVGEVHGHAEGPFLGACSRAEAFLRTWQERLPFGRPLAA